MCFLHDRGDDTIGRLERELSRLLFNLGQVSKWTYIVGIVMTVGIWIVSDQFSGMAVGLLFIAVASTLAIIRIRLSVLLKEYGEP